MGAQGAEASATSLLGREHPTRKGVDPTRRGKPNHARDGLGRAACTTWNPVAFWESAHDELVEMVDRLDVRAGNGWRRVGGWAEGGIEDVGIRWRSRSDQADLGRPEGNGPFPSIVVIDE